MPKDDLAIIKDLEYKILAKDGYSWEYKYKIAMNKLDKITELCKEQYNENPEYSYFNHCADKVLWEESKIYDKIQEIK